MKPAKAALSSIFITILLIPNGLTASPVSSGDQVKASLALAQLEQELFESDVKAIRMAFPLKPQAQYQLLLLRKYLETMLDSEYGLAKIVGQNDLPHVRNIVADSPIFQGLGEKVRLYEAALANDRMDWNAFLPEARLALSALKNLEVEIEQTLFQLSSSTKNKELIEKLAHLRSIYSTILVTVPTYQVLTSFKYAPELLDRNYFEASARAALKIHNTMVIYAWLQGTQSGRNLRYFLRHSRVREGLIAKLKIAFGGTLPAEFVDADQMTLRAAGFDLPTSKFENLKIGFVESAPELVVTTLLSKVSLPVVGMYYFGESFKTRVMGLDADRQGLSAGVLFGLNSFEEARAALAASMSWQVATGVYEAAVKTLGAKFLARAFSGLSGLSNMPAQIRNFSPRILTEYIRANKSQFLWMGPSLISSVPSFIAGEMNQRGLSFHEAIQNPSVQADLAFICVIEAALAFSSKQPTYIGAMNQTATIAAVSLVGSHLAVNGRINWEQAMYVNAYVPTFSLMKTRFIFRPLEAMFSARLLQKMASFPNFAKATMGANRLILTALNNAVGNTAYSWSREKLGSPKGN